MEMWTKAEIELLHAIAAKHGDNANAALAAYEKRGGTRTPAAMLSKAQQLALVGTDIDRKYAFARLARSLRRDAPDRRVGTGTAAATVVEVDTGPVWVKALEAMVLLGCREVKLRSLVNNGMIIRRSAKPDCGRGLVYEYNTASIREYVRAQKKGPPAPEPIEPEPATPTPPPHVTFREQIAEAERTSATPAMAMPPGVTALADAVHKLVKTYEQIPRDTTMRELLALGEQSLALQKATLDLQAATVDKLDALIRLWAPVEPPAEPAAPPPDMTITVGGTSMPGRLISYSTEDLRNGVAKP